MVGERLAYVPRQAVARVHQRIDDVMLVALRPDEEACARERSIGIQPGWELEREQTIDGSEGQLAHAEPSKTGTLDQLGDPRPGSRSDEA